MVRGVTASTLASVLFAALFYYATLLDSLNGEEIFGWRMLFTAPCITAFLVAGRKWTLVRDLARRLRGRPLLALGLVATTSLIATQLWLFVWAPVNGQALEASLGFLLMPLVLVLIGRMMFREHLSRPQVGAVLLAMVGVANELISVGGFSWVTAVVAVGYPMYFVLRRLLRFDNQGGVWMEMHLMLPVAAFFVVSGSGGIASVADHDELMYLIPGLGLISAVALTMHYLSSQLLDFALFGLLIYLEPVLLVIVALLLGETVEPDQWPTYIFIGGAVGMLIGEGAYRVLPRFRNVRTVAAERP